MNKRETRRVVRKMERQRYILACIQEFATGELPLHVDAHSDEFLDGYEVALEHLRKRMWAAHQYAASNEFFHSDDKLTPRTRRSRLNPQQIESIRADAPS